MMVNLLFRSVLVLALLFGLLFAIGMAILFVIGAPLGGAVLFALVILLLQYLLGPAVLEWLFKIQWRTAEEVDPGLALFINRVCTEHNIPQPRFGLIQDGNPNAFTFGHYPGNARLVVTTGLLERLNDEESQAVIAHELGHIAHWDFVVITLASAVPLLLYTIWLFSRRFSGSRSSGGAIAAVSFLSYLAYFVSQAIVLLLSRVREYYADQFAGEVTGNPNALSTALVKVAYGLASASRNGKKKNNRQETRLAASRVFGIFDPGTAQSLALTSAGSGMLSLEGLEVAMKWDMWNPWAFFYELFSTHPLPAKRIRALERQSAHYGQPAMFRFQISRPESYWDEFLVDVTINFLPLLALPVATIAAVVLIEPLLPWGAFGLFLFVIGAAWWLKRRFSYRRPFTAARSVKSLVSEVKVSAVRPIPCTIEGEIIGRGVPGLFFSDDLVLQDESGFIVVDYRQPLRILEFIFGWTKAESLIGRRGKAMGWYRRSPRPYFEMRKLMLDDGSTITSYDYPVKQFFVYAFIVSGIVLMILGILPGLS